MGIENLDEIFREEPDLLSIGHEVIEKAYQAALEAGIPEEEASRISFEAWVVQIAYKEFDMPPIPGIPKE